MANVEPEVLKTLRSSALGKVNQGKRRTYSFYAEFTDIDSKFKRGKFVVHYPSVFERMQIGVTKAALLGGGGLSVDVLTDNIAHIIATLDNVVDEHPDWFDVGDEDLEYDILEAVFTEYQNWVNQFRTGTQQPDTSGDSEDTGSTIPVVDSN